MRELVVNLIRHGESPYKETFPDLTERGKNQAEKTVVALLSSIEPGEKIIIWCSPMARAKGTAHIIREELRKEGIEIVRQSVISSLRPVKVYDQEFVHNFWKQAMSEGKRPDELYLTDEIFNGEKNDKIETHKEVERRVYRLINFFRLFSGKMSQSECIRIVCITHFEIVNPIISQIFGEIIAPEPGENLEVRFNDGIAEFSFRGEKSKKYCFLPHTRKFWLV